VPTMAGLPQMPDASGLDPEQLQHMLALASMSGMGAMMPPPPMPGMAPFPGTAPAFDPTMVQAYSQMLQYLQTQQGLAGPAAGLGMPTAQPPPYSPPAPQSPTVSVSVEGMKFQYQLTEDDLHKVFCRYGKVDKVFVDEACSSALVTFSTFQDAQSAILDLDGKVLNGLDGTLRIAWHEQQPAAAPYMGMSPGPSLPGFPQTPTAPWGGIAPPAPSAHTAPGYPGGSPDGRGGAAGMKGTRKYTCRFLIGIENDKEFQVARRLIGSKGSNMKKIVQQTDAKLRLRGVGSGYFEGSGQKESSEPLQLCISCTSAEGYKTAVRLTEDLLKKVHDEYRQFCNENGLQVPDLQINLSENRMMSSPRGAPDGSYQAFTPQTMTASPGMDPSPKKESRRGGRSGAKKKVPAEGEKGKPGPNAPPTEDIMRLINERNEARRSCNFAEADRIRELLHSQGVALMDEPGARGKGQEVTTWRYWHD